MNVHQFAKSRRSTARAASRTRASPRTASPAARRDIGWIRGDFGERHVPRRLDETRELFVRDRMAIHPEAVHRDAMHRPLFDVVLVGSHAERAAGDPDHVRMRGRARGERETATRPPITAGETDSMGLEGLLNSRRARSSGRLGAALASAWKAAPRLGLQRLGCRTSARMRALLAGSLAGVARAREWPGSPRRERNRPWRSPRALAPHRPISSNCRTSSRSGAPVFRSSVRE